MSKTKLDLTNFHHQVLISALGALVGDDGYTAREVFELIEDCKREIFHALQEMEIEYREKRGKA